MQIGFMPLAANDTDVNLIQQLAYPTEGDALLSGEILSCCDQEISLLVLSGAPDRFPQKETSDGSKSHCLDWVLFAD